MASLEAFIFIACWSINRVAFGYNIGPLRGHRFPWDAQLHKRNSLDEKDAASEFAIATARSTDGLASRIVDPLIREFQFAYPRLGIQTIFLFERPKVPIRVDQMISRSGKDK